MLKAIYNFVGVNSSVLTNEDLQRLKNETDFKAKDIKKCHKKFWSLDKDKKGFVSISDVVSISEIENNPLRFHIAQYMSNNSENESISFEAFIKVIDIFKSNKKEKQNKFIFDLFDFDKDGKISYVDMIINFKLLMGNSFSEEQIKGIVDKTINEYSTEQKDQNDKKGQNEKNEQKEKFIDFNDFVKILNEA